jgi:hypothetical protein
MTHCPPSRARRMLTAVLLTMLCLAAMASSAGAASHHRKATHHRKSTHSKPHGKTTSTKLKKAVKARVKADHTLVRKAKAQRACLRKHRRHCATGRRAVQRAGTRLARADKRLARLGRTPRGARTASATTQAPKLSVSGQTLNWTKVSGVSSYVLVRKVPGQADQYSIVNGTSATPPPALGATVHYSVRTNVSASKWAPEVSITYSATTSTDTQAAPVLHVSGETLSWNGVSGVSTYVLVRKVPGQADQYSVVGGTSVTPPAVPGQTVHFSVRTAVDGSAWAPEVAIAYPSSTTPTDPAPTAPTTDPTPTPTPAPTAGSFNMGVVAGSALSYELPFIQQLGAHTARMTFDIGTPASQMRSTMDAYAKAGVRPLLLATFYGRVPSTSEAQNLGSWAAEFGPGGSFWQGKSYPANTAVTQIELGNETSYTYQFSDNSLGTYASRAQSYALRAKDAATAVKAANSRVGLLAIGDNAVNGTAWVSNMFKAVPDLGQRVAGWTIHPYGPDWKTRIDSTISSTRSAGSPDLPIDVTEWGLSTDNGRCLDDNYGWNKCMTYASAATTLQSAVSGMRSTYGSRLGDFYLYQAHDQYASGTKTGREAYFGGTQSNDAPKGDYTTAVKSLFSAN